MMGAENGTPEDGHKKQREKRARAADGVILAEVMFSGEPVTKAKKKDKGRKDHREGTFKRVTCTTAHCSKTYRQMWRMHLPILQHQVCLKGGCTTAHCSDT